MPKFNKNTNLAEILKYPKARDILAKHKIPCLFCPMAQFEIEHLKLGHVCKMYGIDIDKVLKDLNSCKDKRP